MFLSVFSYMPLTGLTMQNPPRLTTVKADCSGTYKDSDNEKPFSCTFHSSLPVKRYSTEDYPKSDML